jgi:hypothetical protein
MLRLNRREEANRRDSCAISAGLNQSEQHKTRRRDHDALQDTLLIYHADIHLGTIAIRRGIPHDEDPWGWHCGFYPGSHPGEHEDGTAATFDQASADFEAAWQQFLSKDPGDKPAKKVKGND